jgi:hypothetical protein
MVQPQFKGQTYGEATAQERRVQAVPTGKSPTEQRAQQQARRAQPATPGSLTAPTTRPAELRQAHHSVKAQAQWRQAFQ